MNKFSKIIVKSCAALGLSLGMISVASADLVCPIPTEDDEIVLGFFNGINNTVYEAIATLAEVRQTVEEAKARYINDDGAFVPENGGEPIPITYELFYNYTRGWLGEYLLDKVDHPLITAPLGAVGSGISLVNWLSPKTSDYHEVEQQIKAELRDRNAQSIDTMVQRRKAIEAGDYASIGQADTPIDRVFQGKYEYFFKAMWVSDYDYPSYKNRWLMAIENGLSISGSGPTHIPTQANYIAEMDALQERLADVFFWNTTQALVEDLHPAEVTAAVDYYRHRSQIDHHALMGRKFLFVAHSQGNLFMNRAYDYAISKPSIQPEQVRVVHIAPASHRLAYPDAKAYMASEDKVIDKFLDFMQDMEGSALRRGDVTIAQIPSASSRKNMNLGPGRGHDPRGHNMHNIYLNPYIPITTSDITVPGSYLLYMTDLLQGAVHQELLNLSSAPKIPATATQGFFTAMLTWDGPGDVDLHVHEPGGRHVFYSNKRGNTDREGPEHYFASCDSDNLQLGDYKIGVVNYSRAEGRKATLRISGWGKTNAYTRSITLDASSTEHTLYTVNVTARSIPNSSGVSEKTIVARPPGVYIDPPGTNVVAPGTTISQAQNYIYPLIVEWNATRTPNASQ